MIPAFDVLWWIIGLVGMGSLIDLFFGARPNLDDSKLSRPEDQ